MTKPVAFPEMTDEARRNLMELGAERTYEAGEVLFVAGSPASGLYVILEGAVRVMRGATGKPHVIHEEGPGGTLGEIPVFEGGSFPATAVAAARTRCRFIPRHDVLAVIRSNPEIALVMLARMARRTRLLVEQLDQRTSLGIRQRFAVLLLERSHRSTEPFTLGSSQQSIAEDMGTVREIIVRCIRELRDAGVIDATGGGRYVVRDVHALERIATNG